MKINWKYVIFFLMFILILVWLSVVLHPTKNFKIIACDVGQGDAILAIYGNYQILTDGGIPNGKVLSCLSRHMPFWDRNIELVINTHPQLDHYGGLIEVFKRYKVDTFIGSSLDSSTSEYRVLVNAVGSEGSVVINPSGGQKYRLGLMQLEILWPTTDFLAMQSNGLGKGKQVVNSASNVLGTLVSKTDPNYFSIVSILSYRDFDVLLTGDIVPEITDDILREVKVRDIEYIKVPHHGSKNGLTKELLEISRPEIAVISAGHNNRYGHPHGEVLKLLSDPKTVGRIKTYRTDLQGDVVVETDGEAYWVYD